jgi:hypothetical protein
MSTHFYQYTCGHNSWNSILYRHRHDHPKSHSLNVTDTLNNLHNIIKHPGKQTLKKILQDDHILRSKQTILETQSIF